MVTEIVLAALAVGVTIACPRSWAAIGAAVATALIAVALGAGSLGPALAATVPTIAFLLAAVALAGVVVRLGFGSWAAWTLDRLAGGRPLLLYVLVCLAAAVATALVSLDGAVVLLVPVVVELARRGASLRPLLLGVVAVANAFSLALPEGNPTNLVVLERLGAGFGSYAGRTLPAGLAAAFVCAAGVAWLERGSRGSGATGAGCGSAQRWAPSLGSVSSSRRCWWS